MRRAGLAASWLLVLGLACVPARPPSDAPAGVAPDASADAAVPRDAGAALASATAVAQDATAGADPLEGESAGPAAGPADGAAAEAAPAASLPSWLRAVREVRAPSVIGTGGVGPKRVGLQVGHWANEDVPDELRQLRASGGGATGGGYAEVQVNYDLATRTAALLRERGVEVDVLPATVPIDYQADAFVAIHADGDARGVLRGYKVARSPLSLIPSFDDALVGWLNAEYGRLTGLPRDDDHISRRMQFYYAFNNRRYYHAIGAGTPAAIVEAGFMTHAADRALLIGTPDRAAAGLAAGLLGFLGLGG
jgi:hypothetical protein